MPATIDEIPTLVIFVRLRVAGMLVALHTRCNRPHSAIVFYISSITCITELLIYSTTRLVHILGTTWSGCLALGNFCDVCVTSYKECAPLPRVRNMDCQGPVDREAHKTVCDELAEANATSQPPSSAILYKPQIPVSSSDRRELIGLERTTPLSG